MTKATVWYSLLVDGPYGRRPKAVAAGLKDDDAWFTCWLDASGGVSPSGGGVEPCREK